MKRAINIVSWIAVFCTMVTLILTLCSNYSFITAYYFYNFYATQYCMIFTMLMWSIKMLSWKESSRYRFYSLCCLLIAVGTAYFMYIDVY